KSRFAVKMPNLDFFDSPVKARPCRGAPRRRGFLDAGAPLVPGDGHASRRDVDGAPGGVLQVSPVASIRHVRLVCQPDVDLAAAEPRLEIGPVEAERSIVAC